MRMNLIHINMVEYPYLPEGRDIRYVPIDNNWMKEAERAAGELSACSWWPTGAVLVKDDNIIGKSSNEGNWQPLCPRVEQNCPTGEGYHLCKDICQQKGHSEVGVINNCIEKGNDPSGSDLYLFGHWWCCKNCWDHMIEHGVKNVYLLENAHNIFDRDSRIKLQSDIKIKIDAKQNVSRQDTVWIID